MVSQGIDPGPSQDFRRGDAVTVRSLSEVLATLDADGKLGGWHALKGRDSLATTPFQGVPPSQLVARFVRQNSLGINDINSLPHLLIAHGIARGATLPRFR